MGIDGWCTVADIHLGSRQTQLDAGEMGAALLGSEHYTGDYMDRLRTHMGGIAA